MTVEMNNILVDAYETLDKVTDSICRHCDSRGLGTCGTNKCPFRSQFLAIENAMELIGEKIDEG